MKRLVFGGMGLELSSAVAAQAPAQQPLNLRCSGAGTANKVSAVTAHANSYGSGKIGTTPYSGSASGNMTVYAHHQQGFENQVDIRLFSGDDRIRMPRTMLPAIHGGSDGWFKLKDVKADARSIHGSASVNLMNNPKVYIDRITGSISISGRAGDYSGECQVVDANAPAKF